MDSVSPELRERVADTARHRCGYCQSQEIVVGMPFEIEHIIPEALGGSSKEENLWLACPRCNRHKGDRISAVDSQTGQVVVLFDPRRQQWEEHFTWQDDGVRIGGLTPTGRATVSALQLNNPYALRARRIWRTWGWHPPRASN